MDASLKRRKKEKMEMKYQWNKEENQIGKIIELCHNSKIQIYQMWK